MTCVLLLDALEAIEAKVPIQKPFIIHLSKKIVSQLKTYRCSCGKIFTTLSSFYGHFQTHLKDSLTCSICSKNFTKKQFLIRHKRRMHDDIFQSYNCKYCGKFFERKFYGLEHERTVHRLEEEEHKGFKCFHCPRGFDMKTNLDTHLQCHESGELTCSQCHKIFSHAFKRRKHERDYHRVGPRKIAQLICDYCKGCFSRKDALLVHIKRHVLPQEQHVCHLCAKTFRWLEALKIHLKTHSVRERKLVECNMCALTFAGINCLRTHLKQIHGVKGTLRKRDLIFLDKETIEKEDTPSKCSICGKLLKSKRHCKLHELRHEKQYTCAICGFKIGGRMQLVIHERQHGELKECAK